MVDRVKTYDAEKLIGVSRAFTHFLALSNSAENHHRIRRGKERLIESGEQSALSPRIDSFAGTISKLKNELGLSDDAIMDAISKQVVEVVLTGNIFFSFCRMC